MKAKQGQAYSVLGFQKIEPVKKKKRKKFSFRIMNGSDRGCLGSQRFICMKCSVNEMRLM